MHVAGFFQRLAGRRQRLADHLAAVELTETEVLAHATEQVLFDLLQFQQRYQVVQNLSHAHSLKSMLEGLATPRVGVCGQTGQTSVPHRAADGEMIKADQRVAIETQQFVHRRVEEAADAGTGKPRRFRLQIEQLADLAALPVQPRIAPGPLGQRRVEIGEHGEGHAAIAGDVLAAGEEGRQPARIALQQTV
ncbi:hypothetical protein D3C81_1714810 [compost metagenome]